MNEVRQKPNSAAVLLDALSSGLLGTKCWGYSAGRGTGSMVSLSFGGKIKRKVPVKNPHLSDDVREYVGEYGLFLQHCAWRLQTESDVLASWESSNTNGGIMLTALGQIIGRDAIKIRVDDPSLDLEIQFDGGVKLTLFCLWKTSDTFTNYIYFTPSHAYSVESEGGLQIEKSENW